MPCLPTAQICLDLLLRSKTYLKDGLPSTNIVKRELPLPEDVVTLVYTHQKVQITKQHSGYKRS